MHTPNEIKAIKKQRAAASRAYAAALAAYDAIPSRDEVLKELALADCERAFAALAAAREAMSEITRQSNAAATRVYNALYNPLRK